MKYDEKIDEVKVKTADISSKFKFFETYTPTKTEKKPFRITPPREGTVQVNDDTHDNDANEQQEINHEYSDASVKAAKRSNTTSRMLSMFRQMEDNDRSKPADGSLKPLKSFTPPPDDSRRMNNRNSESDSEYTDSEEDDGSDSEDEEENGNNGQERRTVVDQSLQDAQAAARAKQLRAKFEKWEQKEIKREQEHLRLYDGEDQSQIENTKRYGSFLSTPITVYLFFGHTFAKYSGRLCVIHILHQFQLSDESEQRIISLNIKLLCFCVFRI